ncbi:MAG TPA: PliI family lysozyme inhibitor of I-type lysozyme [Burkholderiaceae bacterium]
MTRHASRFAAFALGVAAAVATASGAGGAAAPETRAVASPGVPFDATLALQGIGFRVTSANAGSVNALTIRPSGLEIDNSPRSHEIDGTVTAAEVADLNGDGSPELYVYVTSAGSGSYGSLVAYASNRRKSMSPIHLPPRSDDVRASRGYMGHDQFAVVAGVLRRRFPVYRSGDANARPTGGIRELDYRLVAGEAGWILRLVRTVDRAQEGDGRAPASAAGGAARLDQGPQRIAVGAPGRGTDHLGPARHADALREASRPRADSALKAKRRFNGCPFAVARGLAQACFAPG